MALDHGVLNVPLSKRGNIDAEIDRYKATEAANKKKAHKAFKVERDELRAAAKAAVSELPDDWFAWHAKRLGVTKAKLRSHVKSEAHWNSGNALKMIRGASDLYRAHLAKADKPQA